MHLNPISSIAILCPCIIFMIIAARSLFNLRSLLRVPRRLFSDEEDKEYQKLVKMEQEFSDNDKDVLGLQKKQQSIATEVVIEEKYMGKTSALYDRYMRVREQPIVCHDGKLLSYEFIVERMPIFYPYHPLSFQQSRNRYGYAKKTGFLLEIPKDLRITEGDYPFNQYDENNQENRITHQIKVSQTEKISYREHSKLWRHTDPSITDPHSIQTHSSDYVYLIVKKQGKWTFPSKLLNQKDSHSQIFNEITSQLFRGTEFPSVHWPTKKPIAVRTAEVEGQEKEVRLMTFKGQIIYGIPSFPSGEWEDFAWVPKAHLADYFADEYHSETAWAANHGY